MSDTQDMITRVPNFRGPRIELSELQGGGGDFDRERTEDFGMHVDTVTELTTIATETVDPTSWRRAGGEVGMIREFNGLLVVTQNIRNHRQLCDLLKKLRAFGPMPGKVVRPVLDVETYPEALFTAEAGLTPWVLDLLARARDGKLSKFSSVVVRQAGGRTFVRIGGIWLDTALGAQSRVVLVQRGTAAAEGVLDAKGLRQAAFALGASVVIAADAHAAVSLDDVGITDPKDKRLAPLLPKTAPK